MMKILKRLIGPLLAVVIGLTVWLTWRSFTTPELPDMPLDPVDRALNELVESARQEVRRAPRSGPAWGKLAMILYGNNLHAQAMDCLVHAERFAPHDPRWPYMRGIRLVYCNPHEGIRLLRKARTVAKEPRQQSAIGFQLALVLIEVGQLDEAEACLKDLGSNTSDNSKVYKDHFGYGLLAVARGDGETAHKHLSVLVDVSFARKKACSLLANQPDLDPKWARHYHEQAAQLPPDASWPDAIMAELNAYGVSRHFRFNKAMHHISQNELREAVTVAESLVAESADVHSYYVLAQALGQMGRIEEAESVLRKLLTLDSKNVTAHFHLAMVFVLQAEKKTREGHGKPAVRELYRQAVLAVDKVLGIQSDHAGAHLLRGRALKHLDRDDDAVRAFRQAVACRPEVAEMHQHLGETLAEAGQLPEALVHLENAVRLARPEESGPRQALEKWRVKAKE